MALQKVNRNLLNTGVSDSSDATAITIDSSEKVGIGTAPDTVLHAKVANGDEELRLEAAANSDARIRFGDATDNDLGYIEFNRNSGNMNFTTNNASGSQMRLDSSGNLLVGKTSSGALGTAGFELAANDTLRATKSASAPAEFNRLSDNGDIVILYKDTSKIGSIGAVAGVSTYIHGGTGYSGLNFGNDEILPCNETGGVRDDAIDFGDSSNRFKNGFFSGTVRSGGQKTDAIATFTIASGTYTAGTFYNFTTRSAIAGYGFGNGFYIWHIYDDTYLAGGGHYFINYASQVFWFNNTASNANNGMEFNSDNHVVAFGHAANGGTANRIRLRLVEEYGASGADQDLQWSPGSNNLTLDGSSGKKITIALHKLGGGG